MKAFFRSPRRGSTIDRDHIDLAFPLSLLQFYIVRLCSSANLFPFRFFQLTSVDFALQAKHHCIFTLAHCLREDSASDHQLPPKFNKLLPGVFLCNLLIFRFSPQSLSVCSKALWFGFHRNADHIIFFLLICILNNNLGGIHLAFKFQLLEACIAITVSQWGAPPSSMACQQSLIFIIQICTFGHRKHPLDPYNSKASISISHSSKIWTLIIIINGDRWILIFWKHANLKSKPSPFPTL